MTFPADPPALLPPRRPRPRSWGPPAAGLALVPALTLALAACGGSSGTSASAAATSTGQSCQQVLRSNEKSTAADKAVAAASKKVNAICPGAAS
jgi:hypothetical protein